MRFLLVSTACAVAAILLSSCASQSVYLQQLAVEGPLTKPPLFMTNNNKKGEWRIVPKIAIGAPQTIVGRTEGHSLVNAGGVYQVDTVNGNYFERDSINTKSFQGRNFRWQPPKFTASLTLEYLATRHVAVVLGANYSSENSKKFLSALCGAGFQFEGTNLAVRADVGAQVNSVNYDVEYVVTAAPFRYGSHETQVQFFRESGKSVFANAYGAFTLNTKAPSWPVQGFLQLGISRQTMVQIEKRTAINDNSLVLQSTSFFVVTPGMYFDITPGTRIVAGVHLSDETELLEGDPGVLVVPFIQFELKP